ncbi:AbrB/MazE/SpoVT family DNA-binding domain-containing protein [Streptomyces sp. NPDC048281]|uniref:AbrB/MazE/SpoVT family DNA-binding domain-containing protein n=1 Tax=Streptomyces sp. NPDC048281 TaxID=3154715 RepID=UPI003414C5C1
MDQSTRIKVGPRGRVTIPVALQRAAGLTEGDEVVLTVVQPGVVTIETPQAIKDSIRAGIPADADPSSYDALADVRELRDADTED